MECVWLALEHLPEQVVEGLPIPLVSLVVAEIEPPGVGQVLVAPWPESLVRAALAPRGNFAVAILARHPHHLPLLLLWMEAVEQEALVPAESNQARPPSAQGKLVMAIRSALASQWGTMVRLAETALSAAPGAPHSG